MKTVLFAFLVFAVPANAFSDYQEQRKNEWYVCAVANDCALTRECGCGCGGEAANKYYLEKASSYNKYMAMVSSCVAPINPPPAGRQIVCENETCSYK